MGCCASTTNNKPLSSSQRSDSSRHSKAAPPPEEETVKEVLSETPAPKPPIPKIEVGEEKRVLRPALIQIREENLNNVDNTKKKKNAPPLTTADEVSEVSEICSLTESVSTAPEKRDDAFADVRLRSPARFRNTAVTKSPMRRSEPSPGRVRSVPGRERRGAVGESSGRRLTSPATRAADLGRSPSARITGKSPGRVRSEFSDKTRKFEETNNKEVTKWSPPTTNESLENPLVSLECFIFL